MARNLLDLAESLEKRLKKINLLGSEVAKKLALDIVKELVILTPVDTSKALSNWVVSLGKNSNSEIEAYFPGVFGSTKNSSAAKTVNEAEYTLGAKKPKETIYITNNTKYIRKLNEGGSKQAPAGFVEMAVFVGKKKMKK